MKRLMSAIILASCLLILNGCAVYATPYDSVGFSYGYSPYYYGYGAYGHYGFRPHYYGGWGGPGWRGYGWGGFGWRGRHWH